MAAHRRKNRGFTLIETLIVVGVIAVLVALSLPLFMDAIEKAHIAADEAYERAAIAKANATYATGKISKETLFNYDADNDRLIDTRDPPPGVDPYMITSYGKCSLHKGTYLFVVVAFDGTVKLYWIPNSYIPGFDYTVNAVPHHSNFAYYYY